MLIIESPSKDAFFNLATEEYLLQTESDEVFLLYRNIPTLVVGKFQNTLAEINTLYAKQNDIKVVRRLSGGGAVYHDEGNLNFSFHSHYKGERLNDFKRFTQPIIDFLATCNVHATLSPRNDLVIDNKKFSGNAKFIYRNTKLLQHGTILINSDLEMLEQALSVNHQQFTDKATPSVRSQVTNLLPYFQSPMTPELFTHSLALYLEKTGENARKYELTSVDITNIQKLATEKYSTWEWNYGKSPSYHFQKEVTTAHHHIVFELYIQKGIISEALIRSKTNKKAITDMETLLVGKRHDPDILALLLSNVNLEEYWEDITINEIINGLF